MNRLLIKDKLNRKIFKKTELRSAVLKNLKTNSNISQGTRWRAIYKLDKMEKQSSKVSINNRCIETISKKNFNRKFKLSRCEFRRMAREGRISGFSKAVW